MFSLLLWLSLQAVAADIRIESRWMQPRDLPEVSEIERTRGPEHWSPRDFAPDRLGENAFIRVFVHDYRVVGFAVAHKTPGTLVVDRFAVARAYYGHGVAEVMAQDYLNPMIHRTLRPLARVELAASQTEEIAGLLRSGYEVVERTEGKTVLQFSWEEKFPTPPEQLEQRTLYERLGLPEDATAEQIEKAFAKRAAVNPFPASLALLQQARDVLVSPQRRAAYDEDKPVPFSTEWTEESYRATPSVLRPIRPLSPYLYRRLGVPQNATPELIEQAYKQALSTILRRYRTQGRLNQMLRSLDTAFHILGRAELRREYDALVQAKASDSTLQVFLAQAPEAPPSAIDIRGFNPLSNDAHEILGIGKLATQDEVHAAYARLAAKYPGLDYRYPAVEKAYAILSDPQLREIYEDRFPNTLPERRRELLENLGLRSDVFGEDGHEESRKPLSALKTTDFPTEEGKQTLPSDPPLYRKLGVKSTATQDEIEEVYKLAIARRILDEEARSDLDRAYFILSRPAYRKQYDRTACEVHDAVEHHSAVVSIFHLARIDEAIQQAYKTTLDFLRATLLDLRQLIDSPVLAGKFLAKLEQVYAASPPKRSATEIEAVLVALEKVRLAYPDKREGTETLSREMAFRTRVVRDGIALRPGATDLDALLRTYLSQSPPDYLSAYIRARRDKLLAAPLSLSTDDPCPSFLLGP